MRRIVYLGGLGRVGRAVAAPGDTSGSGKDPCERAGSQTLEFRASIILGSGSLSFEMIRALVERLPVMVAPRWVRRKAQPIAIEDVIAYLVASVDVPIGEQ